MTGSERGTEGEMEILRLRKRDHSIYYCNAGLQYAYKCLAITIYIYTQPRSGWANSREKDREKLAREKKKQRKRERERED